MIDCFHERDGPAMNRFSFDVDLNCKTLKPMGAVHA